MEPGKLIDLDRLLRERGWPRVLSVPVDRALGALLSFDRLNRIESETAGLVEAEAGGRRAFFMTTLKVMGVQYELDVEAYERIPKSGPLIVVSNHPFGGIDGVILGALLQGVRPDARILGNYLLGRIRGIEDSIIEVDPFDGSGSARANLKGMRGMIGWLRQGGCLGLFPAGEVSSFNWRSRSVVDPAWTEHVVALAKRTGASVLPVYFSGRNSLFFQVLGCVHPRIRTLLLAREFCRSVGSEKRLSIGKLIGPDRLDRFDSTAAATEYLRLKTYALQHADAEALRLRRLRFPFRSVRQGPAPQPLASAQLRHRLREEIAALPAKQLLVEHGEFSVYYAAAGQIPKLLLEIGRLREETFRAVREGTGMARDLDDFDAYYYHLFMWDRRTEEVVGAYRIGLVDRIVDQFGPEGLYTNTLFRFKPGFLEKLGPAIELGRSFICIQYQRKHASLALIWRGIGEFIVRFPKYKTLFGPVSITNAYHSISKDLMVHFFQKHNFDVELSRLVKARNPPRTTRRLSGISIKNIGQAINSVDAVSAIVSGFEDDEKGIPILLRHYLKLNGTLLSFNVDPAFSDVIDGLILVDLTKADPRILERYMGKDGYRSFVELHEMEVGTVV
ncbi:MAG: lysophospholipid acyltransferase family protein [Verrucomicrobiota bacterium]